MTIPPASPLPRLTPAAIRVRVAWSIALSTVSAAASAMVLALQVFEPERDLFMPSEATALMMVFDVSSAYWLAPPIVALMLVGRLPRRGQLHALPVVLGIVAIGLTFLCHLVPRLFELSAFLRSVSL